MVKRLQIVQRSDEVGYIDSVFRDQILSIIINEVVKTGRLLSLAEMQKQDPLKLQSVVILEVDPPVVS